MWCVLAQADAGTGKPLPNTCGVTENEGFAAIFCRKGKTATPSLVRHRAEPAIRTRAWASPKKVPLLTLLSSGHAVALGGSHIICINEHGTIACAGYPRPADVISWAAVMTRDTVALARSVGGTLTKRGDYRSTLWP